MWAVIVLTPTSAAYVVGRDRQLLDPTGYTLEGRRQFAVSWGFDREGACAHARELVDGLDERLPPDERESIADAITLAEATPTPRPSDPWAAPPSCSRNGWPPRRTGCWPPQP